MSFTEQDTNHIKDLLSVNKTVTVIPLGGKYVGNLGDWKALKLYYIIDGNRLYYLNPFIRDVLGHKLDRSNNVVVYNQDFMKIQKEIETYFGMSDIEFIEELH